jgi:hypothetical protein
MSEKNKKKDSSKEEKESKKLVKVEKSKKINPDEVYKEDDYVTIKVPVDSLLITPIELKKFEEKGINLNYELDSIQQEIYNIDSKEEIDFEALNKPIDAENSAGIIGAFSSVTPYSEIEQKHNEEGRMGIKFEEIEGGLKTTTSILDEVARPARLMPYVLHLKNLTDEKLYDVDLINYDYQNQNKIAYDVPNSSKTYTYKHFLDFIRSLNTPTERISLIKIFALCDYSRFASKQLQSSLLTNYKELNGNYSPDECKLINYYSPYQIQYDVLKVDLHGDKRIILKNSLELKLSYLMPETEVIIYLCPEKIIH